MKLFLSWKTREPLANEVLLYRSLSPFTSTDLETMEPIAILPGGAEAYVDEDVLYGATYYYRTKVVKGDLSAVSSQFSVQAVPRNGPGGKVLLAGDHESGYFGDVSNPEMPTLYDLRMGLSLNYFTSIRTTVWSKFSYKGKILYVVRVGSTGWSRAHMTSVNWLTLYQEGLVWGEDGPGPVVPTGVTPVNQMRTFSYRGDQFIIRLMRGANNPLKPNNFTKEGGIYVYNNDSEYDRTIGRLFPYESKYTHPVKFGNSREFINIQSGTTVAAKLFAEVSQDGQQLIRGYHGTSYTEQFSDAFSITVPIDAVSNTPISGLDFRYHNPIFVLEWIPNYEQ